MNKIELLDKNSALIKFKPNETLIFETQKLSRNTSVIWSQKHMGWIYLLGSNSIIQLLKYADKFNFSISPELMNVISQKREYYKLLHDLSFKIDSDLNYKLEYGSLLDYQKAGIDYVIKTKKCIIADEMGLGKTLQALIAVEIQNAYPCIIIVPKHLRYNWEDEIKKWLPQRSIEIIKDKKTKFFESDINVIHYDMISKKVNEYKKSDKKFNSMICDEAHYLINMGAKRTQAVYKMSRNIEIRYLLTGTPIVNRVHEFISLLNILDRLNEFGGKYNYIEKFCDPKVGYLNKLDISGSDNLDLLNKMLRSTCYIRRLKKDVLKNLLPKRRTFIKVDLDNYDEYINAENDIKSYLKENITNRYFDGIQELSEEEIEKFMYHKEIKIDKMDKGLHLVKIEMLKQLSVVGKMESIFNWIDDFLQTGEKLIVFATHKKVLELLINKYKDAVHILASDSDEEKRDMKNKFQNDPNCQLIINAMGTSAVNSPGGIGHNLTAASNVAFIEFGWNPSIHDQAEDRAHRIGQQDSVNCWYFVGKNTIDEKIIDLIEQKRTVINSAINDGKSIKNTSILYELLKSLVF